MSNKIVDIIGKVGGKTPVGKVIRTGSNLIKLYRGETKVKNKLGPGVQDKLHKKLKGRWFSPLKEEAKWFSNTADKSLKNQRILKTVNVSEKDYKIGNKMYRRLFGEYHCSGMHCILPKKNLKDVKIKEYKFGGFNDYFKGLL